MKQLKSIIPLSLALVVLVSYQFIGAAWTNAPANPPTGNAETPLHTGGAQSKTGALTTGNQGIISGAPTQQFVDSNNDDWWIHVNSDQMYFIHDVNDNGSWSGEDPWPLVLTNTYALFENGIRANRYCDRNGNNCINPAEDNIPSCAAGKILESMGTGAGWKCADKPTSSSGGTTDTAHTECHDSKWCSTGSPAGTWYCSSETDGGTCKSWCGICI